MTADAVPPSFPAGEYVEPENLDAENQSRWVNQFAEVPARARKLVKDLSDTQLDTPYRNWSIRQIIHHLADSHLNCYVRFRWALTEEEPRIKPYDESLWSTMPDAMAAPLETSLVMLEGIHGRMCELITRLDSDQMQRGYFHPELDKVVKLCEALPAYVWHSDHHLAQIDWVREKHGWTE